MFLFIKHSSGFVFLQSFQIALYIFFPFPITIEKTDLDTQLKDLIKSVLGVYSSFY